jgi:transketolase
MRAMPGMTILAPADAVETRKAVFAMAEFDQPCYMRLGRSDWPVLYKEDAPFEIGRSLQLREGDALTIIAYGQMVAKALAAADRLAMDGLECQVLNMSTIEPLDLEALQQAAVMTGAVVVAEEHQLDGGLGESIARHYAQTSPIPMEFVGMPNAFGESGTVTELMDQFGLNTEAIVKASLDAIGRKV